jgi:hypothetical protein
LRIHLSELKLDYQPAYISIETSIWAQIAGQGLWLHEAPYAPSLFVVKRREESYQKVMVFYIRVLNLFRDLTLA